jgi:Fe2+ or Zn2+ uptake regulation protein
MNTLLQDTAKRLRDQGGRLTSQRRLIIKTLDSLDTHPTAEELYQAVKRQAPDLHLSTVYRTLRWLEAEGLISTRRFEEDNRQDRFDPMLPADHYHFLCTSCHEVIEFNTPFIENIKAQFELTYDAQVEHASIVLYGFCPKCQSAQQGHGSGS